MRRSWNGCCSSGGRGLPRRSKRALHLGDALLVAPVERPLLDLLAADEPGVHEDAEVLACRRLADTELLRDEDAADAVLDEVAVGLGREMRRRIAEPVHDLEPPLVGERLDDVRRENVTGHAARASPAPPARSRRTIRT